MAHHEYPKRVYVDGKSHRVTSAEEETALTGVSATDPEAGSRQHHRAAILDAFTSHIDAFSDDEMAEAFASIPGGSERPSEGEQPDQFDAMDDDALRAFLKDRDGKSPHPRTSRPKLLAAARGDAAATAEAEADAQS